MSTKVTKYVVKEVHQFKGTKTLIGKFDEYSDAAFAAGQARNTATFKPEIERVEEDHPVVQEAQMTLWSAQNDQRYLVKEMDSLIYRMQQLTADIERAKYEVQNAPSYSSRWDRGLEMRAAQQVLDGLMSLVGNTGTGMIRYASDAARSRQAFETAYEAVENL